MIGYCWDTFSSFSSPFIAISSSAFPFFATFDSSAISARVATVASSAAALSSFSLNFRFASNMCCRCTIPERTLALQTVIPSLCVTSKALFFARNPTELRGVSKGKVRISSMTGNPSQFGCPAAESLTRAPKLHRPPGGSSVPPLTGVENFKALFHIITEPSREAEAKWSPSADAQKLVTLWAWSLLDQNGKCAPWSLAFSPFVSVRSSQACIEPSSYPNNKTLVPLSTMAAVIFAFRLLGLL